MNAPRKVDPRPAELATLRRRMARSPFFGWMGIEIVAADATTVEMRMPWQPGFLATPELGGVAGGVLATAIDVGSSYAVLAATGSIYVTIDLRVDFHGRAEAGDLTIRGTLLKAGRTIATCEAEVFDHTGRCVASGRAAMYNRDIPLDGKGGEHG